jgi:hypothetical protein
VTTAENVIERIEVAGGMLVLNGDRIRCRVPEEVAHLVEDVRVHKGEILAVLKKREETPAMPPGVRLLRWQLKPAPVILTHFAVVTNVRRFISMTLLELKAALSGKRWLAGHRTARELVDRLEQCGVIVEINQEKPQRPLEGRVQ